MVPYSTSDDRNLTFIVPFATILFRFQGTSSDGNQINLPHERLPYWTGQEAGNIYSD